MPAWSLDFETRSSTEISSADVEDERTRGRFCWLDLSDGDPFLEALPALQPDLPKDFTREVLRDLDFAEDWLAFGLVEPRVASDRGTPVGINVLFSGNLLITVDFGNAFTSVRLRRTWRDDFVQHAQSPGFFLFEIADHYTFVSQRQVRELAARVNELQVRLFADVDNSVFAETAQLVEQLGDFRHRLIIAHEIFDELATRHASFVPETTRPFLTRNAVRLERTGNELLLQRDTLHSALNLCIGMTGHRTGQLLKRLTAFSIIFLPLSFLAGVFGMNFRYLPGLNSPWSFAAFCALSMVIVILLLVIARRGRWL